MWALLQHPAEYLEKVVSVLQWFHSRALSASAETRHTAVTQWIDRYGSRIVTSTRTSLNSLTNGSYDTLMADCPTIRVFPVTTVWPLETYWTMLPGDAYVVIDIKNAAQVMDSDNDTSAGTRFSDEQIEAIADPNRIAILRAIAVRPMYGRELSDHLDITASTASYHLEKLMSARLVKIQRSEGRRFYYAINESGIRNLTQAIQTDFLKSYYPYRS